MNDPLHFIFTRAHAEGGTEEEIVRRAMRFADELPEPARSELRREMQIEGVLAAIGRGEFPS